MAQRRSLLWPVLTAVLAVLAVIIALPSSLKTQLPGFLQRPMLHLGLDLAGGTQLDFRISEEEIRTQSETVAADIKKAQAEGAPQEQINALLAQQLAIDEQRRNLVEAIRTVLERRINALGVSEATITPSYVGDERHLLVECPGVVDIQECIKVVGKTIQLEFKEEFTAPTEEFKNDVRGKVAATLTRMAQSGATLEKEGQDQGPNVGFYEASRAFFRDQLPTGLESMWAAEPFKVMQKEGSITIPVMQGDGTIKEEQRPGIFLVATLGPLTQTGRTINEAPRAFAILQKTESGSTYAHREDLALDEKVDSRLAAKLQEMQPGQLASVMIGTEAKILFLRGRTPGGEQMDVSHILVSYSGASQADPGVTRTKEEALARAEQLKQQLQSGANFADLARAQSDGPSKKDGGRLGTIGRGMMAPAFEQVAFALKQGEISDIVETQFGYHVIKADSAPKTSPTVADFDELTLRGATASARAEALIKQMQAGEVKIQEQAVTLRTLFFSLVPSGWKETPLDGKHFRHATVTLDPVTSIPVVQIVFDTEGAQLFQELTARNVGKRIAIFVGGEEVTAPTVQQEITGGIAVITGSANVQEAQQLSQDLNTGAIPAPIHLVGQYTVEATLGAEALQASLFAALIGLIILMIYMIVLYRLLGVVACIALVVYALLLTAILKLPLFLVSSNYIVLTLAGMAGIILSLGMAIDANVLVFERLKEELRKGRSMRTAVEGSFKYAWPAIRDGNVSILITCLILFIFGTSIVRGFAITLSMGIFLSLFTAITVTRWILRRLIRTPYAHNAFLFGLRKGEQIHVDHQP